MKISKTHLTPLEAWQDFWENIRPGLMEHGGLTQEEKNELTVANRAAIGSAVQLNPNKTTRPVTLGLRRLKRLLDKHSPGRYVLNNSEPYFTVNEPAQ